MLNPHAVNNPSCLPQMFTSALTPPNACFLQDELGAIAYELKREGDEQRGDELFGILESRYGLADEEERIAHLLGQATPRQLACAIFRSHRYVERKKGTARKVFAALKDGDYYEKRHGLLKVSNIALAVALVQCETMTDAGNRFDVSSKTISGLVRRAKDNSPLVVLRGLFTQGGGDRLRKNSDEEIVRAVQKYGTFRAAAIELGITPSAIASRAKTADNNSPLKEYGDLRRKRNIETAVALRKHGTHSAAAEALGVATGTIRVRLRNVANRLPLCIFVGTFVHGGRKFNVPEEEIVEALERSGATLEGVREAARELRVSLSILLKRVDDAAPGSSLAGYKATIDGWWSEMMNPDANLAEFRVVSKKQ